MSITEDFVQRAAVLRNAQFGEVSGRLAGLLDWMEKQTPIYEIIEKLRRTADGQALILQGTFNDPPPANTPEEIAAVGLVLMEASHNEDFADICLTRGIGPPYNTSAVQPYVDAGLERYVLPFLTHVERELAQSKGNYMPARIAERKFDEILLGPKFQKRFPITHRHLSQIAAEFLRTDADAAWQNVGNSCRQTMIEFCNECIALRDLKLAEETKRGDVKAITRELIRATYGNSRFATALEALVASVWDYAQPLTHRPHSTREEALRMYLWTGLAISEVANLS
jgi:hypothetical protein